jgi:O-antigen biosynthesis protein
VISLTPQVLHKITANRELRIVNREPLVSCITPTANRRRILPQAIRCFRQQNYPNTKLLIIDDGEDPVGDLVPQGERIRYVRLPYKTVLGQKRNRAAAEAKGEIIVHWDDDDWSAPWRLEYQVKELISAGADICGLDRVFFLCARSATGMGIRLS